MNKKKPKRRKPQKLCTYRRAEEHFWLLFFWAIAMAVLFGSITSVMVTKEIDITSLMHAEGFFKECLEHEDYNIYIIEECKTFKDDARVHELCIDFFKEKYGEESCLKEAWVR
ncbi:MAG: hypothetical protein KAT35_03005 [Candidatus Aenigmarchaeota archaeon]|nr:hypothetical protein [Candidatus Aenigmarchaeota archaeon]